MKTATKTAPNARVTFLRTTKDVAFIVENAMRMDGYTTGRLAEEAGVCWTTVQRLIDGDTKFPRLDTVVKMLTVLQYDVMISRSGSGRKVAVRDRS